MVTTTVTVSVACTTYNYLHSFCIPPELITKPLTLLLLGV